MKCVTEMVRNSCKFIMTGGESTWWQDILYVSIRDSHPGEIPDHGDSGCKLAGYAVDHRTLYLADT